jgi:transcriptional regulator with XRE-family HTH domain
MAKLAIEFGKEVRARRKACGLTQGQLAEASSLSEEWVRRIERGVGAPSFDAIEALAHALGSPIAELFKPTTLRSGGMLRVNRVLATLSDAELEWVESVIKTAMSRPAGK